MRNLTATQLIQPPPETGKGSETSGQVRVRQHVNPLARRWSQPTTLPCDWYSTAFEDVTLPLVVDLGVAKGRFILNLAKRDRSRNFLGLEIREPLVHQANRVAADAHLRNVFYISCNVNVALASLLKDVPTGVLTEVYIQFCDPWFKKRHAKRRMVNDSLVQELFTMLHSAYVSDKNRADRFVFLQTDVLEVAHQMTSFFDCHQGFERLGQRHGLDQNQNLWLLRNPIGVPTEREITVQNNHGDVYRALYRLHRVRSFTESGDSKKIPFGYSQETQLIE